MIGGLLTDTGTRVRRTATGTFDALGRPEHTESRTTYPCHLQPVSSTERNPDTTSLAVDVWRLFLADTADITAGDEWEQGGATYRVDGTPKRFTSPVGEFGHIEAMLSVVTEVAP